jgi:glycosyltransferase involved in cell wall biosynthesis
MATFLLMRQRPRYVVFQWWTGTVLHSYLALALLSKVIGARVIVEFHEIVETGEDRIAWARRYISTLSPILMRLADAFAVHSSFDRDLVRQRYPLRGRPLHVLPVGPLDHYREPDAAVTALREAPTGTINLLFFGIIRPYKGLEHLIAAFDLLPRTRSSGIGSPWLARRGRVGRFPSEPSPRVATAIGSPS